MASCSLYIANSTIPGAGLGMFTGVPLEEGDRVGTGDVCVPLIDLPAFDEVTDLPGPFQDYIWDGAGMGMYFEVESADSISAFYPGADAAINAHPALNNVGKAMPTHDKSGLHRSEDHSVGSFTPYFGGTTRVTRSVPTGGELFKDYGDEWFESREEVLGPIPVNTHCVNMDYLAKRFIALPPHMQQKTYELLVNMKVIWKLFRALPPSLKDLQTAGKDGLHSLYQPKATRSIDWLEEHGKCIDKIVARTSTIHGAGRGAFATRKIPKGALVSSSPLIHLAGRDHLTIADEQTSKTKIQLQLNYCFGHSNSTLLLCPYGSGINYINHNSQQPNVKIQWAKSGTTAHDDSWLSQPVSAFALAKGTKLAFDYIAIRDIEDDEEIVLDYGKEWEDAWEEHAEAWNPPPSWSEYVEAEEFNDQMIILQTMQEQAEDPYPPNLETRCHSAIVEYRDFHDFQFEWQYEIGGGFLPHIGRPCSITTRHERNDDESYDVSVLVERIDPVEETVTTYTLPIRFVPRDAIRFFDRPLTSDIHLDEAFRHEIMIPDSMLPSVWMNK